MKKLFLVGAIFLCSHDIVQAQDNLTVTAAETPKAQPWTQPASISLKDAAGSDATLSVNVAVKYEFRLGEPTENTDLAFVRAVVARDNTKGSQVEAYAAEVGMFLDLESGDWFFPTDVSIGFNHKTNFDDEQSICKIEPLPSTCLRSEETSIRAAITIQPFNLGVMERTPAFGEDDAPTKQSPVIAFSWGPQIGFFSDEVIDSKIGANGTMPNGNVSGSIGSLNAAISPKFTGYRLILQGSAQITQTFIRADSREGSFPATSFLGQVSLDYNFGRRSFQTGWAPSFGLTYTYGDDPLRGKLNRDEIVVGIKVAFRPG